VTRILQCQFFETDLGPVFLTWEQDRLTRLQYGNGAASLPRTLDGLDRQVVSGGSRAMREARQRITKFANGVSVSLDEIPLDMRGRTEFQIEVLRECRKVKWGSVVSYGELAERIGKPRAARAVGSVMRSNRHPLVIPCHRVIAASGGLGGYSADEGLRTKAKLLASEGQTQYESKTGLG